MRFRGLPLVLLLLLIHAAMPACPGKPIEVMITGTRIRTASPCLAAFATACAADGVNVHFVTHPPGMDFTAITLDEMKKYDIIVYHGVPIENTSCIGTAQDAKNFRDNLEKFRQMGGGVLFMPTDVMSEVDDWNGSTGAQYDAKALNERLWDPANLLNAAPAGSPLRRLGWYRYNWTTDITPHPVTEGVHGLLLPYLGDWSYPGTVPMAYGPAWQVIVRGMPTTKTIPKVGVQDGKAIGYDENGKGTYASSPQIVAVREGDGGSGRMMILPIIDSYTFQNYGNPLMFDAELFKGAGGHESECYRLLVNAFHWLAAPAQVSGKLGTLVETPAKPAPLITTPVDWSGPIETDTGSITGSAGGATIFKGLFGVRTSYGGGSGTVADYVAAAKAQGLSFLVFMDDAAKMTNAQYEQLYADCQKYSDNTFTAIAGYTLKDEWGDDYFMTDEKRLPMPQFMNAAGQLTNFWGIDKQSRTNWGFGLWRIGHWPVHPWFAAKFHILAPYTYEENQPVDDGFKRYCDLESVPQYCLGVSVSIVTSPDQLKDAVEKTPLTLIQAPDVGSIRELIDENHGTKSVVIRSAYITNGPVIEQWSVKHAVRQDMRPGGDRFQMTLRVKSDAGLKEIEIVQCNTGAVYRVFRPQGQHEFECTIDEANTHQFYLVPRVTDVNGRFALGSVVSTVQPGNKISTMGDRLMAVTSSEAFDPATGQVVQVNTALGMPWTKDKISAGDLRINVDPENSRIWGFDGGSVAPGELNESRKVTTADGAEPMFPDAARQSSIMGSYDAGIADFTEDHQHETNSTRRSQIIIPGIPLPTKIVDLFMRETGLRATIGAPSLTRMYEITVHFKKDTVFKRFDLFTLRRQYPIQPRIWLIKDSAGEIDQKLDEGASFSRAGTLGTGDYICPANEMASPVGFINLGPQDIQYTADANSATVYVDGKNRPVKAGDTVVVRIASISRYRKLQDQGDWVRDYVTQYGIDGSTPAYAPAATQGRILSTDYLLDLQAGDGGATFTTKKADMPNRVLVRLEGLPEHGVYGRYDLDSNQLRLIPWYDGTVYTSIKPAKSASHLYVGEIFHCSDPAIISSAVQDGPDKVLAELNNPTDQPRTVTITGVPGFAPLAALKETITIGPGQSVKRTWPAAPGSLIFAPDMED